MLNYPDKKASENEVNLDRFFPEEGENCGDFLSEVCVKYLLEKEKKSNNSNKDFCHLYAIGSILQMGYQDACIWGTGFAFELDNLRSKLHSSKVRKLDVRAVRGPKTRSQLLSLGHECPEIYGDPAIIMPLIYTPQTDKTQEYIIIPHFSMFEQTREKYPEVCVINMDTADYKYVIDKICSAKKVITSSLHGIILAETYGVPAVYYSDRPERFQYKYEDWYESTNRKIDAAKSVEEAVNKQPPVLPELDEMRKNLIKAFPYDLWK